MQLLSKILPALMQPFLRATAGIWKVTAWEVAFRLKLPSQLYSLRSLPNYCMSLTASGRS